MTTRSVPLYCPYCSDEDVRPHESQHGTWHCRACARVFSLKFVGLALPAATPTSGDAR